MPTFDWSVITTSAIVSGAVAWLLRVWFQSRLDTSTRKRVAQFQAHLDAAAAAAAFEYQRELQSFNLFIGRKYEVATELYHRVLEAQSQIGQLIRGERFIPEIASMNADDARRFMIEHSGVPEGLAADIVKGWQNREASVRQFEDFLETMRPEYARRAVVKANNYRLRNELFLSDQAALCAAQIIRQLFRTFDEWQAQGGSNASIRAAFEELHEPVSRLKHLLKSELLTPSGSAKAADHH